MDEYKSQSYFLFSSEHRKFSGIFIKHNVQSKLGGVVGKKWHFMLKHELSWRVKIKHFFMNNREEYFLHDHAPAFTSKFLGIFCSLFFKIIKYLFKISIKFVQIMKLLEWFYSNVEERSWIINLQFVQVRTYFILSGLLF